MKYLYIAIALIGLLLIANYAKDHWPKDAKAKAAHFTVQVKPGEWTAYTLRNKSRFAFRSDDPDAQSCFAILKDGECDSPYYLREQFELGNDMPRTVYFKGSKPVEVYYSPLPM